MPAAGSSSRGCGPCSARSHLPPRSYPDSSHSDVPVPTLCQTLLPCAPIRGVHSSTLPCFQAPGLLFKETFAQCFKKCKLRSSASGCHRPFWSHYCTVAWSGTHIWGLNVLSISPDEAWIFTLLLQFGDFNMFFIIAANFYLAELVIRFITAWKRLCQI